MRAVQEVRAIAFWEVVANEKCDRNLRDRINWSGQAKSEVSASNRSGGPKCATVVHEFWACLPLGGRVYITLTLDTVPDQLLKGRPRQFLGPGLRKLAASSSCLWGPRLGPQRPCEEEAGQACEEVAREYVSDRLQLGVPLRAHSDSSPVSVGLQVPPVGR